MRNCIFFSTFALTMSCRLAYVHIHPYLKQWAEHHYGSPVRFPNASVENALLHVFARKRPLNARCDNEGKMAVVIPDSKDKPADTFCYLSASGEQAIRTAIHNLMKIKLWNDLFPLLDPASGECVTHDPILSVVRDWCRENGIDPDYDYTIKMKWQRMREAHPFPMRVKLSAKNNKKS